MTAINLQIQNVLSCRPVTCEVWHTNNSQSNYFHIFGLIYAKLYLRPNECTEAYINMPCTETSPYWALNILADLLIVIKRNKYTFAYKNWSLDIF